MQSVPQTINSNIFVVFGTTLLIQKSRIAKSVSSAGKNRWRQNIIKHISMSSSNRAPFQDITNGQIIDPRELKRQRDRKRYAKNKDEILKRRRQLRELKKQSTAPVNDENTLCDTHDLGESVLTQLQFRATEEDVAPDVQQYASQDPHGSISIEGNDDESEWLHRCNAYHMNETRGRMIYQTTTPAEGSSTQFKGLEDIVGSNNVSLQQMGASSSRSAMGDPVTDLCKCDP